jgi:hypothetical protein
MCSWVETFPLFGNKMVLSKGFDKMEKRDLGPVAAGPGRSRTAPCCCLEAELPKEINGRKGPEPTRFGDWENKGIASDF